jgi:hypothetical protein
MWKNAAVVTAETVAFGIYLAAIEHNGAYGELTSLGLVDTDTSSDDQI